MTKTTTYRGLVGKVIIEDGIVTYSDLEYCVVGA